MSTIQLDIVTPERLVYSKQVNMVITKAANGDIGILPNHAPLVSTLAATRVRAKVEGKEESVAVSCGFLEVRPDKVTILAETAELPGEIDKERALRAKERAEKKIKDGNGDLHAELALQRAINRISLGE
jgi:F-type H+-transporting ATPase subunit epsilon